ncbi:MAG: TldD/PmbA family protein [Bacilli bacterium]
MKYDKLIKEGLKQGFSDLEIYSSISKKMNILVFQEEVEKNEVSNLSNYTIRGIFNGKMAYLNCEKMNQSPKQIIKQLKDNASSLTTKKESEIFEGSSEYNKVIDSYGVFDNISTEEKINILLALEKKIKKLDERIIHIPHCSYDEAQVEISIVNSKGLNLNKKYEFAGLAVQVVAKEDKQTQSYFDIDVQKDFSKFDIEKLSKNVVDRAVAMLSALPVDSNDYDVIFENKTMIDLLAAFSPVFSGEEAMEKATQLSDKIGQVIANEKVNIIEDPFHKNAIFNDSFDDEGVATYKKSIIENGKLLTLLHNLKSAKYFKTKSTGNGVKKGSGIGIGNYNLFIGPGEKSLDQIIKETKNGLLITKIAGLHAGVNCVSGDFSLQSSGFHIVDGEIKKPVNLIVVSGNFFKIIKNDLDVANDLKFSYNSFGAPSIKFKSLQVSGK